MLVHQNPKADHLDLTAISHAEEDKRNYDRASPGDRRVLSDGLPIWQRTLRSAILFPDQQPTVSDEDRLLTNWSARFPDTQVTLSQLCETLGWRKARLVPALAGAMESRRVKEVAPTLREGGRGRQPTTAFVLAG